MSKPNDCNPRRPFLCPLLLAMAVLSGCFLVEDPEKRVEEFLRAEYKGDGYAMQDMLLRHVDDAGFQTIDEWLKTLSEKSKNPESEGATEKDLQNYREKFDAQVAKASLDLVERGQLKAVETSLVERNGEWACVQANYRFEDGSTLAKDQYGDKKGLSARFAPDGYYFLLKKNLKWFILDSVPREEEQRFSVTTAAAFLEYLLEGKLTESRMLISDSASGPADTEDPFSELAKNPEYKTALTGWSLQFQGRRENERMTVISYEVRVMDAEQTVQTAEAAVIVRLRDGEWEVDHRDVSSTISAIQSLASLLDLIRQEKARREAEELRRAQLQPVLLLDQARSLSTSSWSDKGMSFPYVPPRPGRLRLDVQVLAGSPLHVDLMPTEEHQELRKGSTQYKTYPTFRGREVIRQSFEMPVSAGVEYVLFIRPSAAESTSDVELKYWFLPTE